MRASSIPLVLLILAVACSPSSNAQPPADAVLFEGARVILGDGSTVIEDGAFLVEGDLFGSVGRRGELAAPDGARRVDLTGKTVMPALVDLHSHLGYTSVRTMTTSADAYTRENLIDHLRRYAYYGVSATLSLGLDRGDLAFQLRDEAIPGVAEYRTAGRGIAMPNAGPLAEHWRDAPYGVTTEIDARRAVEALAAQQVDIVKIWVDDRGGTVEKLPPYLYRAIIDEAHQHGLRVVAHVYYLEDGKELLRAGIDGFAHGIRDTEVDAAFVDLLMARPDVFLIPNLPDQEPGRDDLAELSATLPATQIDRMREALSGGDPARPSSFGVQARSLVRLNAAGVRIGFGTDAGTGRPFGWSAHAELADMVAAGLTPAEAIRAATQTSADILGLADHGTVAEGKRADFIVLEANPLDEISNSRRIARVYVRGREVDRAALSRAWTEPAPISGAANRGDR